MAGPAVQTIYADLQDGALEGSGLPEIYEFKTELGNMIANGNQQRVGRHRRRRKKNVGELPHINSRPEPAPPEQPLNITRRRAWSQCGVPARQHAHVGHHSTILSTGSPVAEE